ncbi:WAT1-related protein At5g07050-like isoform X2 [Alnus glutinosa]|uniref:WAT1-related protein At5g07050-like isoform X2 n=1 Tax=Alnus glutinosa TaxID=3517 RepID=UPI002D76A727|nr:WAT1-related protein At5g07050-like isoform X2 [Alnus glutinosa]
MMKMEEQEESVRGERGRVKREEVYGELKPYIYCIFSNFCFAGYNIISKVALDKGMSRYVLVVYGHAFGTLATALLAFMFERAVLGRTLLYAGLEKTTPAIASALGNLTPTMTFILALLCRMEKLEISRRGSQAKILGTVVAFGGAILMTLYRGIAVISLHTRSSHQHVTSSKLFLDRDSIKGSLMLGVAFLSLSAFYILQVI